LIVLIEAGGFYSRIYGIYKMLYAALYSQSNKCSANHNRVHCLQLCTVHLLTIYKATMTIDAHSYLKVHFK